MRRGVERVFLDSKTFKTVVAATLVSIDLLGQDSESKLLLGIVPTDRHRAIGLHRGAAF